MKDENRDRHSEKNLMVIQNFILHLTHAGDHGMDDNFEKPIGEYTPKQLYEIALEYIEEDHSDGLENPEDIIPIFGAESSFVTEDIEKEFPESLVVVADFGEEIGTQTVATFSNPEEVDEFNEFLEFMKCPFPQ